MSLGSKDFRGIGDPRRGPNSRQGRKSLLGKGFRGPGPVGVPAKGATASAPKGLGVDLLRQLPGKHLLHAGSRKRADPGQALHARPWGTPQGLQDRGGRHTANCLGLRPSHRRADILESARNAKRRSLAPVLAFVRTRKQTCHSESRSSPQRRRATVMNHAGMRRCNPRSESQGPPVKGTPFAESVADEIGRAHV